ncbi:hypothetical protein FKM82_019868, partial [Ascaphus truei]
PAERVHRLLHAGRLLAPVPGPVASLDLCGQRQLQLLLRHHALVQRGTDPAGVRLLLRLPAQRVPPSPRPVPNQERRDGSRPRTEVTPPCGGVTRKCE